MKVFEVNGYFCGGIGLDWAKNVDWRKLEDAIKKWAAEHPEQVYPTWADFLEKHGILVRNEHRYVIDRADVDRPIPADIAEKLGIEPKGAGT